MTSFGTSPAVPAGPRSTDVSPEVLLPDATVLTARAQAKVTGGEPKRARQLGGCTVRVP
ncbi:hypothetical protein ACRAKI_22025 [Saccharothrix isguenensis]